MTEQVRESLSALLDQEATELDVARIMKGLDQDQETYEVWRRYNLARDAIGNDLGDFAQVDLSARVRESLGDTHHSRVPGRLNAALKPFASVAVAATVTAAVLTGTQLYQNIQGGAGVSPATIAEVIPDGRVNTVLDGQVVGFGNAPVEQAGTSEQRVRQAQFQADLLAQRRLDAYLQAHSDNAALNASSGLMPMARTVSAGQGR